MGPGCSSYLRIGDDSSVVVGTERAGGASDRLAVSEPGTLLKRLLFPWMRENRK